MTKAATTYYICLDTNQLRDNDWLKASVVAALESLKAHKLPATHLVLPEVVRDEWVNNYLEVAQRHIEKIKTATENMGLMELELEEVKLYTEDQVRKKAEDYLSKLGFQIIPTPYKDIDFRELATRAVRHTAPFEVKREKGFKDALIAQSIKAFIDTLKTSNHAIAVVSGDQLFQDYIKELTGNNPSVHFFGSLSELQSAINLESASLGSELTEAAASLFYSPIGKDGLFIDANLFKSMRDFYEQHLPTVAKGVEWLRTLQIRSPYITYIATSIPIGGNPSLGDQTFRVGRTTFLHKHGDTLSWATEVDFTQEYIFNDQPSIGYVITMPSTLKHKVTYSIKWTAKLGEKGELLDAAMVNIDAVDEAILQERVVNYVNDKTDTYGLTSVGQSLTPLMPTNTISSVLDPAYINPGLVTIEAPSSKSAYLSPVTFTPTDSWMSNSRKKHFWD